MSISIGLFILSCNNIVDLEDELPIEYDLELTPRANEEAEDIALWLADELIAPEYLYNIVDSTLTILEEQFSDSIPVVASSCYNLPWLPSCLVIGFHPESVQEIRDNNFHILDSLNNMYRLIEMDTNLLVINTSVLYFQGRLHSERLNEIYSTESCFRYIELNIYFGGVYSRYAMEIENGISFLYREGYGDCPSGCSGYQYWYFRVQNNIPEFVGTFHTNEDPIPDWWEEAKYAKLDFTGDENP